MGLFSALLGNASIVSAADMAQQLEPILGASEQVELAFQLIRDQFVFTNKRLILIDKQGLTGHKVEYLSIPYRSITRFSIETAGHFDADAEMKLWIGNDPLPMVKELRGSDNISAVQKALATAVLGA
ncbi:helicase [Chromatium okenii]|uniref:PH domain-containing protein n=1 Tax=Chromatium okenii TaxID=61644 RepID=UPI00190544F3|nr:PH domain-containing protein [Chromatium okenii]MBK1642795.1 helicase [Chromatium okenii]